VPATLSLNISSAGRDKARALGRRGAPHVIVAGPRPKGRGQAVIESIRAEGGDSRLHRRDAAPTRSSAPGTSREQAAVEIAGPGRHSRQLTRRSPRSAPTASKRPRSQFRRHVTRSTSRLPFFPRRRARAGRWPKRGEGVIVNISTDWSPSSGRPARRSYGLRAKPRSLLLTRPGPPNFGPSGIRVNEPYPPARHEPKAQRFMGDALGSRSTAAAPPSDLKRLPTEERSWIVRTAAVQSPRPTHPTPRRTSVQCAARVDSSHQTSLP